MLWLCQRGLYGRCVIYLFIHLFIYFFALFFHLVFENVMCDWMSCQTKKHSSYLILFHLLYLLPIEVSGSIDMATTGVYVILLVIDA